MEVSEERTVHRLEAFSDIVIGFGLAQLGAVEILDPKTASISAAGLLAFFGAFAIICSLWYFHHRLFENFFTPRTLPIILNFLWLAVVVLLVFCAAHFNAGFGNGHLDMLYFGLYAAAYGILALQTALGIRVRADADAEKRMKARRNVAFMAYWTLVFLVCFVFVGLLPPSALLGNAISWTFIVGAAGSFGIGMYYRRLRAAAGANA